MQRRRVLVPGGTGAVGEGIVRAYLAAGAEVVVPTRTAERAAEFGELIGANGRLHLVVHDYTTFAGAEELAAETERRLGGIDDVVAPIGGWWAGRKLREIDETDWQRAFLGLATTHMAVLRACLPRMSGQGAYLVVVGESAFRPVPGSGLVSMEQAALLMMRRVAEAEGDPVLALVLGPVRSRAGDYGDITAEQVGEVAVALSKSQDIAKSDTNAGDGNTANTDRTTGNGAGGGAAEREGKALATAEIHLPDGEAAVRMLALIG